MSFTTLVHLAPGDKVIVDRLAKSWGVSRKLVLTAAVREFQQRYADRPVELLPVAVFRGYDAAHEETPKGRDEALGQGG